MILRVKDAQTTLQLLPDTDPKAKASERNRAAAVADKPANS